MLYLVVAVAGILAGGYGGYKYGRSVEAKVQAVAAALKQSAQTIGAAAKN